MSDEASFERRLIISLDRKHITCDYIETRLGSSHYDVKGTVFFLK